MDNLFSESTRDNLVVVCLIVWLIQQFIPEIRDVAKDALVILMKLAMVGYVLYMIIARTPWMQVTETTAKAWFHNLPPLSNLWEHEK